MDSREPLLEKPHSLSVVARIILVVIFMNFKNYSVQYSFCVMLVTEIKRS